MDLTVSALVPEPQQEILRLLGQRLDYTTELRLSEETLSGTDGRDGWTGPADSVRIDRRLLEVVLIHLDRSE